MKKIVSLVLAAATVGASGAFVGCFGGEAKVNYTLSEDGTYYILSSVSNKSALTEYEIPATYTPEDGGETLPVKAIGADAFNMCSRLTSVTIPDSVTEIGYRAFAACSFKQIDIPDSVTSIAAMAFYACNMLESIVVPSGVTALGADAFMRCSALKRAEVYANVTKLNGGVFYNVVIDHAGSLYLTTSLTEVVLSSNIKKIETTAFYGNVITDVYYTGTEEEWDEVGFYTVTATEKDGETKYEEVEKKQTDCFSSETTIHFNYSAEG